MSREISPFIVITESNSTSNSIPGMKIAIPIADIQEIQENILADDDDYGCTVVTCNRIDGIKCKEDMPTVLKAISKITAICMDQKVLYNLWPESQEESNA